MTSKSDIFEDEESGNCADWFAECILDLFAFWSSSRFNEDLIGVLITLVALAKMSPMLISMSLETL